jgi:hypothetical protein
LRGVKNKKLRNEFEIIWLHVPPRYLHPSRGY